MRDNPAAPEHDTLNCSSPGHEKETAHSLRTLGSPAKRQLIAWFPLVSRLVVNRYLHAQRKSLRALALVARGRSNLFAQSLTFACDIGGFWQGRRHWSARPYACKGRRCLHLETKPSWSHLLGNGRAACGPCPPLLMMANEPRLVVLNHTRRVIPGATWTLTDPRVVLYVDCLLTDRWSIREFPL